MPTLDSRAKCALEGKSVVSENAFASIDRIDAFKKQGNSLRIPASRIAALAGYHPFAVLPKLLIDLVYQGPVGHALRLQDCHDLGIELVSTDVLLMELAQKAGSDTAKALEEAIKVKEGSQVLENVKAAARIKMRIMEEAKKSKNLNREELKRLEEGSRSYVDTGFGTSHEDSALDLFQRQCGWEVRDRNASIINWPFARSEDVGYVAEEPTVVPLAEASAREPHGQVDEHPHPVHRMNSEDDGLIDKQKVKPFFVICGAVDGVRDELCCCPNDITDRQVGDDDWKLRKVIVECKHRMRRGNATPPLYDQIQTTAYCLMYGTEVADIIQVFRKEKQNNPPAKRTKIDGKVAKLDETRQGGQHIKIVQFLQLQALGDVSRAQSTTTSSATAQMDQKENWIPTRLWRQGPTTRWKSWSKPLKLPCIV
ncbi:hypothetical protein MHU86_25111 [Fragilaria crotonensis]|nr:hypothetical protein MHU86_25111 [Fragilaria crotonensis]